MAQGILVFIEEREGKVKKTSLEVLSAACKLAELLKESVIALRVGAGDCSVDLAHYGADKVISAQHELLNAYGNDKRLQLINLIRRTITILHATSPCRIRCRKGLIGKKRI